MEKAGTTSEKPKRKTASKSAAAAPKAARTRKSVAISAEMRRKMIADAAYFRAEKHGSTSDDVAHWLAAEAEIDAMLKKGGTSS
ncbi:MAG: DUF2934 domain-containing protein [Burkholderiales bacterium]